MDDQYPEMALFTDFIELRTRIEDLPPLPPSATPRQQGYRDFLQDLLTLPSSIPDQEEPSSDSDDATQNDDLNLLVSVRPQRLFRSSHWLQGSTPEDTSATQG